MRLSKTLAASLLMTVWAGAANADGAALILSQDTYRNFGDVKGIADLPVLSRSLQDADFDLSVGEGLRAGDAWDAVADFREDAARADRVLVYLSGRFVNNGDETWLLTRAGDNVSDLNVGAMGVPLSAILNSVADHPERALVLLAPQGDRTRVGAGLSTGISEFDAPEGVSVLIGPSRGLSRFIERVALKPDARMLGELRNGFPNVESVGYLSNYTPFTPAEASRAERNEIALNLTRDERRDIQRDLTILGFAPGAIDGIFGRGTRAAISDWQEERGRKVTGFLNERQLRTLRDQASRRAEELAREARERQLALEEADNAFWERNGKDGDVQGLIAYLQQYPDGLHADKANAALDEWERKADLIEGKEEEKAAWKKARQANTVKSYNAYLKQYPQGSYAQLAQKKISELEKAKDQTAARKAALARERSILKSPKAREFVERRLKDAGLEVGKVDGTFDAKTRKGIKSFQKSRGLKPTGYVDQITFARVLIGN